MSRGPMANANIPGEKPKSFKKSMVTLVSYSKRYLPAMIIAFLLAFVTSGISLVGPSQLSKITNIISAGLGGAVDVAAVAKIGGVLAVLYCCSLLLGYLQGFVMATLAQKISRRLRSDISKKISKLPLSYFDKRSFGDVLSRVTNDVDTIGNTLNQSLSSFAGAVIMFFGALVLMLATNWIMAFSALISTALGFLLMIAIITNSQKFFSRQQGELGKLNGFIEETFSGHTVVKAYNGEHKAEQTFLASNSTLYQNAWKAQFLSSLMMPIMGFVGNLGYVTVCITGSIMVLHGGITFGDVVAFMVYVRLFTQPLSQIAQIANVMQSTAAASERVFQFLEEDEMQDESHKTTHLETVNGDISFKNVSFGYTPEAKIIKDFSIDIKAGQKVAIVGPTGAGKTTLVNLLMRFYELNGGSITVDNVPLSDLTRENIHNLFGMVLQDTWMFEDTIKENIVYSKQGVTQQQVEEACKAVGLHHFISTLPKGYDTLLNDKANLSAGQKQLVTIARAMIENAPMIILDEATSSVDTRTEILIQQAMDTLSKGRTSFIIAHRLSTIKNAHVILVMKDGDIVESGSHDELMAKGGFYCELYNSQFEPAA